MLKKTAFSALLLGLSSCSYLPFYAQDELDDFPLKSVEVFMSRGSLMGADFEQYKLDKEELYFECGEMKQGRKATQTQELIPLSSEVLAEISSEARKLTETGLASNSLPDAGSGTKSYFADPGKFVFSLATPDKKIEVKTSVDGVAAAAQPETFYLKKLTSLLRGAVKTSKGAPACGRGSFYGIETRFIPPSDVL